jgi:histidinol-phosphate aminotransferase
VRVLGDLDARGVVEEPIDRDPPFGSGEVGPGAVVDPVPEGDVVPGVLASRVEGGRIVEQTRVRRVVEERARVAAALTGFADVRRVYPSQGNFLLVRFVDADATLRRLLEAGVVVRDMRSNPVLADALRISIGAPAENDVLLAALAAGRAVA